MAAPVQKPPVTMSAAAVSPYSAAAVCCHCGAPDTAVEWFERFKLLVCTPCLRRHERLITKSNAKSVYLLSDGDLSKLGYMEKQNPRHQKFANMKQYLVSQVEEVAVAKHGSLEALEEEKQRRMQGKLEQRMQKRQAAEQEEERQRRLEARLQATLDKYTSTAAETPTTEHGDDDGQLYRTGRKRKKQQQEQQQQDVPGDAELEGVDVEEF